MLGLQGRALVTAGDGELDDDGFSAAVAALLAMLAARSRVVIDTIDGVASLESPRVGMLAAMRFHSDGRALVHDGLHGPTPARAIR